MLFKNLHDRAGALSAQEVDDVAAVVAVGEDVALDNQVFARR